MWNRLLLALIVLTISPIWAHADSSPQELVKGSGPEAPKQPQAFIFADGTVDVVYVVADGIRLATSRDRGESFTPAKGTIHCPNLSAGMRRGPRIVRTKSAVIITAIGGKQGKGRDGDLMAWRSTDDGATWSDPVKVNDVPDAAREGLHGMTLDSDGNVWCAWLDLRNRKSEIYTTSSTDDGQTWRKNVLTYRSPSGSVCECCHPSIIAGLNGDVTVMFRNSLRGQRDMFVTSTHDGKTFSAGRKLGQGSWKLDGCPMDGGMLASDGKGELITVWRRDHSIFATSGNDENERLLGEGQQPWTAWSAAGPVIVCTNGRDGALLMQIGLNGKPSILAPAARDPVVASHPQSNFALVCWEEKAGGATKIMSQTIPTPSGVSVREQ